MFVKLYQLPCDATKEKGHCLRNDKEHCLHNDNVSENYVFRNYAFVVTHGGVLQEKYKLAYFESVENSLSLEDLFYKYNMAHPNDYHCRSMSVSDVVVIENDFNCSEENIKVYSDEEEKEIYGERNVPNGAYFCDNFGFKKLNENEWK